MYNSVERVFPKPMRSLLALVLTSSLLRQDVLGLQFINVGDWGDERPSGIEEQKNVAMAMNNWCGTHECLFILDTGDNFYPVGVQSATDERFDTSWRWIYNLTNIEDKLWYIALGNHDHGPIDDGREQFQVEFGLTEPRWYYPSLWYDVHYTDGVTRLHLIFFDSQSLKQNKNDPAAQLAWLETTLAGSTTDDWKIVVDHHPPYAASEHGPIDSTIADQVVPLVLQYGAHLLLSGHEHNLQHLTQIDGAFIDYVISGGGGRGLYPFLPEYEQILNGIGINVDSFNFVYGFVSFDFSPSTYTASFVDKDGSVVYSYTRSK